MEPRDFDIRRLIPGINTSPAQGISSVVKGGAHVLFADGTIWYLHNDAPFEEVKKFFTISGAQKHDREVVLGQFHD
jgi:hypothetical protein